MTISIELPSNLELQLRAEHENLDGVAKLGLAVEAYRAGTLSLGQFAELLGISHYEADGILKERGVMLEMSEQEMATERDSLRRLTGS